VTFSLSWRPSLDRSPRSRRRRSFRTGFAL
jgi:hypothetical protein